MKFIFFILSVLCFFFFYDSTVSHFSEKVFITSYIIQIISLYNIFDKRNRLVSLHMMVFLFSFFFFGIAPLMQFYGKTVIFGGRLLSSQEYFTMNLIIIVILLLYSFFYNVFFKYIVLNSSLFTSNKIISLSVSKEVRLCILSLISFIIVLYFNNFNLFNLLLRGGGVTERIEVDTTTGLIVGQFIRPIPIIAFCIYLYSENRKRLVAVFLMVLGLLTTFPTGIPRFYAAAVYIPVLCIIFEGFRKKRNFALIFIILFIIVFPFMDSFRHISNFDRVGDLKIDFTMFQAGHFDSYYNFALIVLGNYITYGRQLLGVVFFWIPRSIWPTKPSGSGYYLAGQENFTWDNVSANFFAEGFINFGFIGIFIFVLLLSYVTAKFDKIGRILLLGLGKNFLIVPYFILFGMIFFMLRGDLLSSFSFTIGYMLAFYIIYKFVLR